MKNFKQQFKDFRNNTPKHIQWLLLAAAFIVVIILLTLMLGKKPNSETDKGIEESTNATVEFKIEPSKINLTDVEIGSSKNTNITLSINTPVVIKDVTVDADAITTTNNCDDLTEFCMVNVIYKPVSVQSESETILKITWHDEAQPSILKTEEVTVKYSSKEPETPFLEPTPIETEPTPVEPEPISEPEPELAPVEPEPISEPETPKDAKEEVRDIAVPNPFKAEEDKMLTPEKCSEFAIPGYDPSGRQIGWIKPERGANYFHPFSDTDCSNPTGKYDFTTGIITSLTDGSKIGTDSDHIGYRHIRSRNVTLPNLSAPATSATMNAAGDYENAIWTIGGGKAPKRFSDEWGTSADEFLKGSAQGSESVVSSRPYDRTFILRQFKPIPATIVSEVRADPSVYGCNKSGGNCDSTKNHSIPVRATVDRNVYSDDGRTVILPTGTLLMGYLDGDLPGPYQAFGRMNIKWYQFIRPDGVEFNFSDDNQDPYSADAQGRMGVPGHGSTDYVEQMVMPILTSLVPAAVNMIAPIADTVINQIDLDNNTIVQSGTIRSSEMAKQDVINTWNKITQKLLVDAIDNTVPPFSIAAGTRINVFSPVDLIVTCGQDDMDASGGKSNLKKCAFVKYNDDTPRRSWAELKNKVKQPDTQDSSWIGQVRSFNLNQYCEEKNGKITIGSNWADSGSDYRTVLMYCESQNYQAKNNAKQAAYNTNLKTQSAAKYGNVTYDQSTGTFSNSGSDDQIKAYNTEVLGLTYDDDNNIIDPFASFSDDSATEEPLTCGDGSPFDENGCCPGETYTDMGADGFNCCPDSGGDCFPPTILE